MAFHQPTRQATQRVYHPTVEEDVRQVPRPAVSAVDDSQTWVLFSPINDAATTTSYLTETHRSESTPGRSRLSDLGSVHTIARSDSNGRRRSLSTHEEDEEDEDDEEDDAELDSLDSHLPEFRSTPHFSHSAPGLAPIVPAHDGLGSFRLDHDGMGPDVQDRLYAFEKYNPRRVKRRRESLELAQVELDVEQEQEVDKMGRIEAWRLEQSRCLLEEIQKETRRRRRSAASVRSTVERVESVIPDSAHSRVQETADEDGAWHDQQASDLDESETFLGRITRKVIRDIMGIDDKLLSILFGESLPDEDDLSSTPKASTLMGEPQKDTNMTDSENASWQLQMLERIAKELGSFVYQLSEHPGAFSTYTRMQQMPIPYAGLPPIAETTNDIAKAPLQEEDPRTSIPEFKPTIPIHSSPIDVPQTKTAPPYANATSHGDQQGTAAAAAFTQDEWEQDLDVRLIFRYLRSRFLSRSNSTGSASAGPHLATSSNQDAAAKAARVRQHHPLVSKVRPSSERRTFRGATPTSPVLFRRASSCASQSTRKSVRRSSCSSRHYWDIGAGSVGTGSLIAAAGPMGSWGEI